uniref:TNFR-Cys domain-containing protein n=1 Tax=Ciona savignyi TaxID=51511 RepID=H2YT07_CIOSA
MMQHPNFPTYNYPTDDGPSIPNQCYRCPPGYRIDSQYSDWDKCELSASALNTWPRCVPCPEGYYSTEWSKDSYCVPQKVCDGPNEVTLFAGTTSQQALCGCKDGYMRINNVCRFVDMAGAATIPPISCLPCKSDEPTQSVFVPPFSTSENILPKFQTTVIYVANEKDYFVHSHLPYILAFTILLIIAVLLFSIRFCTRHMNTCTFCTCNAANKNYRFPDPGMNNPNVIRKPINNLRTPTSKKMLAYCESSYATMDRIGVDPNLDGEYLEISERIEVSRN